MTSHSDLPDTATGVLRLIGVSKTDIDHFSDQIIQDVREGNLNPLELRVMVKSLELILDRVNKETQDNQLRAADLYPGQSFELYGAKIVKGDTKTTYDYEGCNDLKWAKLNQRAILAKLRLSEREGFLKGLTSTTVDYDEETGEEFTITPPVKKSTAGLKVSIL